MTAPSMAFLDNHDLDDQESSDHLLVLLLLNLTYIYWIRRIITFISQETHIQNIFHLWCECHLRVCADLGWGIVCCCGPHGSGVAAMAQLSQCKTPKHLPGDEVANLEYMGKSCSLSSLQHFCVGFLFVKQELELILTIPQSFLYCFRDTWTIHSKGPRLKKNPCLSEQCIFLHFKNLI